MNSSSQGWQTKATDPLGNEVINRFDATGYRSTTGYNARGEVVAVTNANGETVRTEYDALGRRTALVDALGYRSEFAYDANGNLTCTVDANAQAGLQPRNRDGCSESRVYDELNRVILIVDALNGETAFTYDYQGNRLTVKDAENKTWSFAYDDLGRLKSETDHSGKSLACQSDEAGNVFQKTNRLGEVKVSGFAPHHINNVADYPHLAGNPDNIKFVDDHLAAHGGNFQNSTSGSLIDRTAGGQLPRVRDTNGYSIKGALLGAGAAILSGAADAAELLETIDPSTYMFHIPSTGGCNASGVCSDMINWNNIGPSSSNGAAGGGFLLYLNKANTNMMQSVYSK